MKRCIERQDIDKDDFTKKADFPRCTRRCSQGRKILKALGGAVYLKKIKCDEPGCSRMARQNGKCSGHASKAYREKSIEKAKNKEKTMAEKLCGIDGCSNLHLAKGLCHKHYHERYRRDDKKPDSDKVEDEKLSPLLNDLEEEINKDEDDYQPDLSLNEVFDEIKSDDTVCATIDFTDHPKLKAYLEASAKRDFRNLEGQIMFMLDCSMKAKARKTK